MKRLISMMLCITLCLGMFSILGSTTLAENSQTVQDGVYTLKNVSGGYMMNVYAGKDANGTKVTMWEFDGTTDQQFYIQHQGNGKYLLKFKTARATRVVDINRGESLTAAINDGDKVDLWTSNDPDAQLFYIVPQDNGSFCFELVSMPGHVITPTSHGNAKTNGAQLQLKKYNGSTYQQWYLCDTNGNRISTACTHSQSMTVDKSISITPVDASAHKVVITYDKYCASCTELISADENETRKEAHIMQNDRCTECGYEEIKNTPACTHSGTTEQRDVLGVNKKDAEYHTIEESVSIICNACSTVIRSGVETQDEVHVFLGDTCTICLFVKAVEVPEYAELSVNKTTFEPGEAINLTWTEAARATSYGFHIDKDNQKYDWSHSGYTGTSASLVIDEEGIYEIAIYASNSAGHKRGGSVVVFIGNYDDITSMIGKRIANVTSYKDGRIGECVWYVRGRAKEKLGVNTGITGNANVWYAKAIGKNLKHGTTVKANSIACFNGGTNGHVIFVEAVIGNKVYYTEANVEGTISDGKISPKDGVLKVKTLSSFTSNRSYQGCIYLQ